MENTKVDEMMQKAEILFNEKLKEFPNESIEFQSILLENCCLKYEMEYMHEFIKSILPKDAIV